MKPRVTRLKNSVRLVQHGCVLSETPVRPGPTHSVFDVLAAAVVAFAPPGPVAMLGFAGGGMVAPLRKAGYGHEVRAVDLCARGHTLFRSVSKGWGGALTFEKEDALRWLRRQRGRFGAIVEDLSVPRDGDVVKPEVSWRELPPLIGRKLRADGVAVANILPTPGVTGIGCSMPSGWMACPRWWWGWSGSKTASSSKAERSVMPGMRGRDCGSAFGPSEAGWRRRSRCAPPHLDASAPAPRGGEAPRRFSDKWSW